MGQLEPSILPLISISFLHHWMKLETLSLAWKVPGCAARLQVTPVVGRWRWRAIAGKARANSPATWVTLLAWEQSTAPVSSTSTKVPTSMSSL